MIRRHVFARRDTMDFHPWVILKTAEEFGRDEEILAATATAYVFLRTTGIPLMVPHPEPLDVLGLATTAAELRAASAAVPPNSRKV